MSGGQTKAITILCLKRFLRVFNFPFWFSFSYRLGWWVVGGCGAGGKATQSLAKGNRYACPQIVQNQKKKKKLK